MIGAVCRLLKRPSSKAAGSEDCAAYLFVYVERFERLRTKLGGFFSSLLELLPSLLPSLMSYYPYPPDTAIALPGLCPGTWLRLLFSYR